MPSPSGMTGCRTHRRGSCGVCDAAAQAGQTSRPWRVTLNSNVG